MSTNARRSSAMPSFLGRIWDWFQHAWGTIQPGRLAWKGAALGLLVMAVLFLLITADTVFLAQPRMASFLVGSAQFFAIAATVMRRVLVEYARRANAARRGGGANGQKYTRISLEDVQIPVAERAAVLLDLDEASLGREPEGKATVRGQGQRHRITRPRRSRCTA